MHGEGTEIESCERAGGAETIKYGRWARKAQSAILYAITVFMLSIPFTLCRMPNAAKGLLFMVRFAPATAIALAAWGMAHAEFSERNLSGGDRHRAQGDLPGDPLLRYQPSESQSTLSVL